MADNSTNSNSMFGWGNAEYNQLGIAPTDGSDTINEPTQINAFSLLPPIKDVVCGDDHTVFVCRNGSVYSCGRNDSGQLGHDSVDGKLDRILRLENQPVRQAACGQSHSVLLTDSGQVYSCGDNSLGQLGIETSGENAQHAVPVLVTTLSSTAIVQVACGFRHTLALSQVGGLYAWGSNSHGQLGIGNNPVVASVTKPQLINSLRGLAFTQIAAGGNSSFALTVSGAIFGWGRNNCGQLGVGNVDDYWYPVLCKSLRSLRPKFISCGTYHVAVLTEDGGVFTFGCGTHGQLGHSNLRNECVPHKIFELMGSTVTQVASGSCHTMALLAPSGQMYVFGAAVGSDSEASMAYHMYGPNVPSSGPISKLPKAEGMETRIFCGSNQCFILSSSSVEFTQAKHLIDRRVTDPASQIFCITEELVQQLCCTSPVEKPPSSVMERLEAILSSDSCWNSSFLTPGGPHSCTSKNPGVDLPLAKRVLGLLYNYTSQNKIIFDKVQSILEKQLLYALPSSPADVDALRVYMLMPQSPFFEGVQYYSTIVCPFAQAVIRLDKMAAKVLDNWFASLEVSFLLGQVTTYKKIVVHILLLPEATSNFQRERRFQQLVCCLEMLKKFNAINELPGQSKISYDEFYITELREKLNITEDYINWLRPEARRGICFCAYPFVFNGEMKSTLLQTEAMFQMQAAVEEATRLNLAAMFMSINPVNPLLVLQVRRTHLVHDVVSQLQMHQKLDFKKPLKVIFIDEEGQDGGGLRKVIFIGEDAIDEGGVRKEFFLLLAREILDPKYGMFKHFDDSNLIWFNESSLEEPSMFNLIGVLCGLAIYNFTIVDIHFPLALYKKLLRRRVTLEDLAELQPTVARSLQHMLKYEDDDFGDVFALTFEVTKDFYGTVVTEELIPGGSKVAVTKENKQQYVDCYVDYVFYKAVDTQFKAFGDGFHRVCGGRVLDLFHPKELQAMVVGNELYDWEAFDKNTEYKGEFHRLHPTIVHFWNVFQTLTQEEKKKFLLFLSGSDRIPIMGMQAVKMIIQSVGGGENFLPVAHTCFNLLDLPKYSSEDVLRAKLLQAIQQSEGFALI